MAEALGEAKHISNLQTAAFGWVEVEVVEEEGSDGAVRKRTRKTRRFMPQYSALYLRTRRPQEHGPRVPATIEGEPAAGSNAHALADRLAAIAADIRDRQFALDAEYRDVDDEDGE